MRVLFDFLILYAALAVAQKHWTCPTPTLSYLVESDGAYNASALSCLDKCIVQGHCCTGNGSGCQMASCAQGCSIATVVPDELTCNNTCMNMTGHCDYTVGPYHFELCGGCPQKWLNPDTLQPEILPGGQPWWPPGWQIPGCGSCNAGPYAGCECMVGCRFSFNQAVVPVPPVDPPAPPDIPIPPAPWPNANGTGFNFSVVFSDHAVLQQAPAAAAVYGPTGTLDDTAVVTVTVTPSNGSPYTVPASVSTGRWKALLKPTPDTHGAITYKITATCTSGCNGTSATLNDVVFGDVWYCAGQSNMVLEFTLTYGGPESAAAITAGTYDNIRLQSGSSESEGLHPTVPPTHPWRTSKDALAVNITSIDSWWHFSSACWHFAEAITDAFKGAGKSVPTLGLISTAIGGSQIEEWITDAVASQCFGYEHNSNGQSLNHVCWDSNVRPFLDMTITGALYYQGENNAGALHGNSAKKAGYSCMIPRLVDLWRREWSATPGTTSPTFPFGIVTLSTGDSEGAYDIGSFRFAQTASWGALPNPDMQNTWTAQAYDLADPWYFCEGGKSDPGCDNCEYFDPRYNCSQKNIGPSIHPRLKKPVGQRLAAGALVTAYNFPGPVTGPTLSGCTYSSSASSLTLTFDASRFSGGQLQVQNYLGLALNSGFSALVNSTDNTGAGGTWVALNISLSGPAEVAVDLAPLWGAHPQAIKYAWGATGDRPNGDDVKCCLPVQGSKLCLPAQCPIFVSQPLAPFAGLPGNPFLAQITPQGKCLCPTPQICDA